jgi:hypothetical protein
MCTCGHSSNPMTALQDQSPVQKLLTATHVNKMAREKHYKTSRDRTLYFLAYTSITTEMYSTNMLVIRMGKQLGVHHILCPQTMCQIQDSYNSLMGVSPPHPSLSPGQTSTQTSTHLQTLSKYTLLLRYTLPDAYFFLPITAEASCCCMVTCMRTHAHRNSSTYTL